MNEAQYKFVKEVVVVIIIVGGLTLLVLSMLGISPSSVMSGTF